ncbi:IclR family transcriptional regulator [Mameliella alba]|nr:IclR family transcriptional regulator [Mameliella alba]MBY6160283.1 IclR family transcriptional regulator [Mameliella alba]MBY6168753.1 IclR family transcriptional regulator [Mameliella alba]MBY6174026.1 IclR family transcriptional regulator [Mameliella alba]MCA0956860.1 IclR family transcriptional regulator [Mameliella alba]
MPGSRIQSIERATAILEVIARQGGSAKLAAISELTGLGKTTAHNILRTLSELGYLHRRPGDSAYYLGARILNLARIAGDDDRLRAGLRPALLRITEATGFPAFLAVPSGDQTLYLDANDPQSMAVSPVGTREPLEGTAVGLVFLAFMPALETRVRHRRDLSRDGVTDARLTEVRRLGFALDLEYFTPGVHCVSVPFREQGEVRAALAIAGPKSALTEPRMRDAAWKMLRIGSDIQHF